MSGSRTSVAVVSLLAFWLLHTVWAVHSPGCPRLRADVQFLLDTSKYVSDEEFAKAKEFMKAFALEIDSLKMGVITYRSNPRAEFWMNQYTNNESLLAAIDRISFTPTDEVPVIFRALKLARENAFTKANGDREGVINILIVLGDGRSAYSESIVLEKVKLNEIDIRIYTVGFFDVITPSMMAVTSKYADNFRVNPYNDLDKVRVNLIKAIFEEITALDTSETGTFTITTHVSNVKYSGTGDWYYIIVQFGSGKNWEKSVSITPGTGFYVDTTYNFDTDATYYGIYDPIKYVLLYKNVGTDDFFPDYFTVNGPKVCDFYECNWTKACAKEHGGSDKYADCFLKQNDIASVPCELANEAPACAELYI